jgi:hypothetical protein
VHPFSPLLSVFHNFALRSILTPPVQAPEDLDLKISILGRLDRMLPKSTIIATSSASFRSGELVSEVRNRSRVLNTLYYIPPRNRCVEMMSCGYTSPELIAFLRAQMEDMGMLPIVVGNESTGLIFPRIFGALKRETLKVGLCLSPNTRPSLSLFQIPPFTQLTSKLISVDICCLGIILRHRNTHRNRHPLHRFLRCPKRALRDDGRGWPRHSRQDRASFLG